MFISHTWSHAKTKPSTPTATSIRLKRVYDLLLPVRTQRELARQATLITTPIGFVGYGYSISPFGLQAAPSSHPLAPSRERERKKHIHCGRWQNFHTSCSLAAIAHKIKSEKEYMPITHKDSSCSIQKETTAAGLQRRY